MYLKYILKSVGMGKKWSKEGKKQRGKEGSKRKKEKERERKKARQEGGNKIEKTIILAVKII